MSLQWERLSFLLMLIACVCDALYLVEGSLINEFFLLAIDYFIPQKIVSYLAAIEGVV